LCKESKHLTAFLLPDGKRVFLVAPMGLMSSSDEFNIRTDAVVQKHLMTWLLKIIDNMLIQAPDLQEAFQRLRFVLACCRKAGIKLSLAKLCVGRSVKFAGHIVGSDGIRPDPAKLDSIRCFLTPTTVTELKSFLGLANQLGVFLPDWAHATVGMRELLKKNNAFLWLASHAAEFDKVRALHCSSYLVRPFNMSLPTELLTDASPKKLPDTFFWFQRCTNESFSA
jgi:hypothetical protein